MNRNRIVPTLATFLVVIFTGLAIGTTSAQETESFNWLTLNEAQQATAQDGKTIMVFVEAEWCGICRRMEREVFRQEVIQDLVDEKYYPVTIDLDSRENVLFNGEEMTEREFARIMNVSATPTFLFIDSDGEVIAHQIGFNPVERFEALLAFVVSDQFGEISFEEFIRET